jgi:hypothetical protein
MPHIKKDYQTKSAVLFIIFNRLETSLQVLAQIRRSKPAKLYITADGPRTDRPGEFQRCEKTRVAVMNAIDWDCQVNTLFRNKNLGPKEAISSAITWFFEREEEGIILEHDCLPANSFFLYCDVLLEKYRDDKRVWLISGCNLQNGNKWGNASYYFSNLTNGWGWATWRRSWNDYDKELSRFNNSEVRKKLENIFEHPLIIDRWVQIFEDTKSGQIDTWDYQVTFAHLFSHSVTIAPNYNLVSNIGFGELAENTTDSNSPFANVPLEEIQEITHPIFMVPEKLADLSTLVEEFKINEMIQHLKKHNSSKRRIKRWFKSLLNRS